MTLFPGAEYAAGYDAGPLVPSFPPAATTTTLCWSAYCTALSSDASAPPPRLRLITPAPLSTAHVIPLATSLVNPLPSPHSTCTGKILTPGAVPEIPVLLLLFAAMIPDTCVPCPLGSVVPPRPSNARPRWSCGTKGRLSPCPARSGWFAMTPVSTSATVTPAPWDPSAAHAATNGTSVNDHCCANNGSFGFASAFTGLSTSTAW